MSDQAIPTPSGPKLVDLDRLTQADVARLIGKPTSYLRNHEHRFARDAEGRYSGRQVVAAMLSHQTTEISPLELSATDHELSRRLADILGTTLDRKEDLHATIRFAVDIRDRCGIAGLAAIFAVFLDHCRLLADIVGPPEVVAVRRATIFDVAAVCVECGAVRRGREWVAAPRPAISEGDTCPKCLKSKEK